MKKIRFLRRACDPVQVLAGSGFCTPPEVMVILLFARRPLYAFLVLCVGALVSCSGRDHGVQNTEASAIAGEMPSEELSSMLTEVNRQREAAGVQALALDSRLNEVAQNFAADMSKNGYFSHTSPSGQTFDDRLAAAGIEFAAAAENIAKGEMDVAGVVGLWMNSPGHRANLLDPRMKRLGVGHSGLIWVQEFTD